MIVIGWLNYPSTGPYAVTLCSHCNDVIQVLIILFWDASSPSYLRNIVSKFVEIMITVICIRVMRKCGTAGLLTGKSLWLQSLKFGILWDIRNKLFTWIHRLHEKFFWDVWNASESQMRINHQTQPTIGSVTTSSTCRCWYRVKKWW